VAPMPGWPPTPRTASEVSWERLAPVLRDGADRNVWSESVKAMEVSALEELQDVHLLEYGYGDRAQLVGASSKFSAAASEEYPEELHPVTCESWNRSKDMCGDCGDQFKTLGKRVRANEGKLWSVENQGVSRARCAGG
jgi:hypothetical protein